MNSLSDMYFLDSNIMLFTQFVQHPHDVQPGENTDRHDRQTANPDEMPEQKLSNLERLVALNDDVYEIVPVDPLANCETYHQNLQDISYSYMTEGAQVNEGLAVLEILYNHPIDAPEFIDINDLVAPRCAESPVEVEDAPGESEVPNEDDDVIFVAEYKPESGGLAVSPDAPAPRRNPIRKARKNSRALTKDLLYDEDYAILESSSDDDVINETLKKSVRSTSSLSIKDFRKWPVNGLHERPEYDDTTKRLEKFDYTIRQIRNSVTPKKLPQKIIKKAMKKRKYIARRKAAIKTEMQEKVSTAELEDLVESTLEHVRQYVVNLKTANRIINEAKTKENRSEGITTEYNDNNVNKGGSNNNNNSDIDNSSDDKVDEVKENGVKTELSENVLNGLELFKSQAILYQVINNVDVKSVRNYFNDL